ncbi:MAG TPA: alpha/beta hydrolase [Dongiaceae bacterium]|nr:alpha/beta hydrolase [Dongiaceae bacterium]
MLLFACAPRLQPLGPSTAEPAFGGNQLVMDDGTALPLRHWPAHGETKAVIMAVHGFNEYSKVFDAPAREWAKAGIETYAFDQRGFGETDHRGVWAGDERMITDVKEAAAILRARRPDKPFYVLGESMGGAVVMAAATEPDPLKADGLILVAPAIWGRETIGPVGSGALWFFAHTIPWYTVDGRGLHIEPSDNRKMLRELARDPLIIKETRVDAVYGLVGLMDRAWAAAPRMPGNSLFLYGAKEQVIDDEAAAAMLRRLPRGPSGPRVAIYPNGYHMLLRDLHAEVVRADIVAWVFGPRQALPSRADLRAQRLLLGPATNLATAASVAPALPATR